MPLRNQIIHVDEEEAAAATMPQMQALFHGLDSIATWIMHANVHRNFNAERIDVECNRDTKVCSPEDLFSCLE